MWTPESLPEGPPLYIALADALQADLDAGRLDAGERLPTHRSLARRLGINVMTVTRGYAEAARRGLVEGEVGRGTFVRSGVAGPQPGLAPAARPSAGVDFHLNVPALDPSLLDPLGWATALQQDPRRSLLLEGYTPLGLEHQRAVGAAWVRAHGVEPEPQRVVITGGVQHGLTVALACRTSPGDTLLVEELTYPGAKALAAVLHLRLVPVPCDSDGPLPDALEALARKHESRAFYCMPTVHNPTGRVIPDARRAALVEAARAADLDIFEDDTYAFAAEAPPRPLAALAPERVWHFAGTSKSIAAGLRVGFLTVPDRGPGLLERLAGVIAATAWMTPPALVDLACRWIEDGTATAAVRWRRTEAAARQALLRSSLHLEPAPGTPAGSPHVWLQLPEPWLAQELAALAREAGVALTPAEAFVAGRAHAPQAIRLALGTPPSREETARGLAILARVLQRPPLRAPMV